MPGCTIIYNELKNGSQITGSCFKFPNKSDLREKWLNIIGIPDDYNTENAGVCSLLFDAQFVKTHCYVNKIRYKKPQVLANAVPTIFSLVTFQDITETNRDLISNFENLTVHKYSGMEC